jgi:hypothetical protein
MSRDTELSEVVVFEIPGFDRAMRLYELLGSQWLAWVESGDGIRRVSVLIQPDEGDLATLLRVAERWVAEAGLGAIRFEVDGRTYVLETGGSFWSTAAA